MTWLGHVWHGDIERHVVCVASGLKQYGDWLAIFKINNNEQLDLYKEITI